MLRPYRPLASASTSALDSRTLPEHDDAPDLERRRADHQVHGAVARIGEQRERRGMPRRAEERPERATSSGDRAAHGRA